MGNPGTQGIGSWAGLVYASLGQVAATGNPGTTRHAIIGATSGEKKFHHQMTPLLQHVAVAVAAVGIVGTVATAAVAVATVVTFIIPCVRR